MIFPTSRGNERGKLVLYFPLSIDIFIVLSIMLLLSFQSFQLEHLFLFVVMSFLNVYANYGC